MYVYVCVHFVCCFNRAQNTTTTSMIRRFFSFFSFFFFDESISIIYGVCFSFRENRAKKNNRRRTRRLRMVLEKDNDDDMTVLFSISTKINKLKQIESNESQAMSISFSFFLRLIFENILFFSVQGTW